ncbi:hypothetical protein HPB48_001735 [Haemaphysalis longicornis]|uniref:adenosine deaminase n=1 Tax=Haemaphysalis longicornis TaxID=44386 RepID=A0A9J6FW02_HAELO|nr:hypothetical protein HPB48_001735 [Haemaphysalis longicornis]
MQPLIEAHSLYEAQLVVPDIDGNFPRRQKGLDLGYSSVEDVKAKTKPKEGTTLDNYLKEVFIFLRTIVGDRAAMERVAYEAGVDQASEGVIYSEMRLPPQLLAASTTVLLPPSQTTPGTMARARDVVDAALEGLRRAERETGAKLRLILTWPARNAGLVDDRWLFDHLLNGHSSTLFLNAPLREGHGRPRRSSHIRSHVASQIERGITQRTKSGECGGGGSIGSRSAAALLALSIALLPLQLL